MTASEWNAQREQLEELAGRVPERELWSPEEAAEYAGCPNCSALRERERELVAALSPFAERWEQIMRSAVSKDLMERLADNPDTTPESNPQWSYLRAAYRALASHPVRQDAMREALERVLDLATKHKPYQAVLDQIAVEARHALGVRSNTEVPS